ncbi:MAG: serine hydrolase [Bacteroidota bacterium]
MLTPVDSNAGYALGLGITGRDGEIYFGHGGWDEGFSSEMVAHRDKGYGVVVLTNSNHPSVYQRAHPVCGAGIQVGQVCSGVQKTID